ncbi:MAG TPA: D-aminoacyl-tRNA deacylase [Thermoanaerobaculaceae bacterium]|nr:D-aminoacyl-tRNA deacylase [Thermoanaerobaculaceae bacterium]
MRIVAQRASRAEVRVGGKVVGRIGAGLVLLVGVEAGDGPEQVDRAAHRFSSLRAFDDGEGHMNRGLGEVGGELLVVSQFTLAGSIRRGRRPDFAAAERPERAEPLVSALVAALRERGVRVSTGVFRAMMEVELVNDGPVTFVWEDRPEEPGTGVRGPDSGD